jgi:DNA-binding NarL/FixJ family response regulator
VITCCDPACKNATFKIQLVDKTPEIMARSSIRVWVVEDSEPQRTALIAPLREVSDMQCTAAFADCETMLEYLGGLTSTDEPDVVLMDIELDPTGQGRRMNGIAGAARLRAMLPDVAIVMLTQKDGSSDVYDALEAGACGYLKKPTDMDAVVNGIREAHRGGMCMSPPVARMVLQFFQKQAPAKTDHELTDREREILRLMERGGRQKQIADALYLSPHTIDSHLRKIYQKLHVNSAAEALASAIRKGEI